jgi:hypothetical protein
MCRNLKVLLPSPIKTFQVQDTSKIAKSRPFLLQKKFIFKNLQTTKFDSSLVQK